MLDSLAGLGADAEPGTHLDLGADVGHISVAEFTSKTPEEQWRFEAHHRYVDIHVVLAGEEHVNVAALDALEPVTEFDEGSDIGFHEGEAIVSMTLRPGWFAVFHPSDAHRPGLCLDSPATVLKAVGKLRVA